MPSLAVLYSTGLSKYALEPLLEGKSATHFAIEQSLLLPNVARLLVLTCEKDESNVRDVVRSIGDERINVVLLDRPTAFSILSLCAQWAKAEGNAEDVFIAPLEAPFIDVQAMKSLFERHKKYKAEYSFAEGYPEFLFAQVLNSGLCSILSAFAKEDESVVSHSFIFDIIKKDINSYDIEVMIAPCDARMLKMRFLVETKRDLMFCQRFAGIDASNYVSFLESAPLKAKTLPRYYMIELCPEHVARPIYTPAQKKDAEQVSLQDFRNIVKKIADFSDDAIISLSLYGEPLLHKNFVEIVKEILLHKNLSVLVETHGTCEGSKEIIDRLKDLISHSAMRPCNTPPLYWITCIDAQTPSTYAKVYEKEEDEARKLLQLAYETAEYAVANFGKCAYVQFVRMNENENDLEGFYRSWTERGMQVIIQKHDHFCQLLPDRRVADLSPLQRMTCRHLGREMCICCNGDVILCREDAKREHVMGNVLQEDILEIWQRFDDVLEQHIKDVSAKKVGGLCELCDEYYTSNF